MKTIITNHNFPYIKKGKSVSSIINSIKKPFDADRISKAVAAKKGVSQREVLDEWEESRKTGSFIHKYIASVLRGEYQPSGLESLSTRLPQQDQFDQFWSLASAVYEPVWVECPVSSIKHRLNGRIDTLLRHKEYNTYHVVDWKTGKFSSEGYNRLFPPFDDMTDSSLEVGSIQTGIYNVIIPRSLGFTMGEGYLVFFDEYSSLVKATLPIEDRVEKWLDKVRV